MSVSVDDLRREFEASGVSFADLSRALGWKRAGKSPRPSDGPRVRRVLGYKAADCGHGYGPQKRRHVRDETAAAIRAAIREATR